MPEGSDPDESTGSDLPMLAGQDDPSRYRSQSAKERFAVAKFYGMGSDGEWTPDEIGDALDCSTRQVYRYLNESEIGRQTREMLAVTEAEWRLDMAMQLRKEVRRLEEIEKELLERQTAVPTEYETKTVRGTPTGDRNIKLPDDSDQYRLEMPVPTDFETVTDYKSDLQNVQAEKRRYLEQISDLLGLNESDKRSVDENLAGQVDEVKIVEFRQAEDEYPEAESVDMDDPDTDAEVVDISDRERPADTDSPEVEDDAE